MDEPADDDLVALAREGDREALTVLVRRHQGWIHALALGMTGSGADAEDVAQEVLVKLVTHLASFRGESSFKTWVHRTTVNHVLSMRSRAREARALSFEDFATMLAASPDEDPPGADEVAVPPTLLFEEVRETCTAGMLLCLDREQRVALLLGAILRLDSREAAALLEVTPAAFRQRLSRARADLRQFVEGHCGLVDPRNPCRCERKTRALLRKGLLDPERRRFPAERLAAARADAEAALERVTSWLSLFKDRPIATPDLVPRLVAALEGGGSV